MWGPSLRISRLIYFAVVRPRMLYGSQIWGRRSDGQPIPKTLMGKLEKVQNKCLRKITGGYKRTPRAILEREANIPHIDLQISASSMRYGATTSQNPVTHDITQHVDTLWTSIRANRRRETRAGRRKTAMEVVRSEATAVIRDVQAKQRSTSGYRRRHRRPSTSLTPPLAVNKRMMEIWKRRWMSLKGNNIAATWKTTWEQSTLSLSDGLKKFESTALMLLRSEIIGLNAWLSLIKVPGISPQCTSGEPYQTVKHILFFCLEHQSLRAQMLVTTGTDNYDQVLQTKKGCHAAVKMLIDTGRLEQFRVASTYDHEKPTEITLPQLREKRNM
ncbi:hypothetical protein Golomagni_00630 [Golovinomyces magnicellulatus]|nr:hypothetical protein Golomagni_00630 [Golovinomyces magnicellulatus]